MENSILSGLGDMGLGKFEGLELYEKTQQNDGKQNSESDAAIPSEDTFLFDKTFECPVCYEKFKSKMVRAGRVKALEPDDDLRPRSEHIDILKYDVIACPKCGYASLLKTFQYLAPSQKKAIKENISESFVPKKVTEPQLFYTYEEALERHKLALVNTIVKRGKAGEKAHVCLRAGWIVRGMRESLKPDEADYETKKLELERTENQFLKNAYDGMIVARSNEGFPICGLDEVTFDYLLARLAIQFEEFDVAAKLIAGILSAKSVPTRIKEKTRDLKSDMFKKMRGKENE